MLEIDNFVEVPIINAFSDYERVINELVQIGKKWGLKKPNKYK